MSVLCEQAYEILAPQPPYDIVQSVGHDAFQGFAAERHIAQKSQKAAVRDLHAEGVGVSEIARRFNATRPLIYRVLNAGKAPKAEAPAERETAQS